MSQANAGSFSVYATFTAKSGQYQAMKEIMRHSCDLNKDTPWLLQMVCLEPPKEDKPFVFISIWESHEAFNTFLKTPSMKEFHNAKAIKKMQAEAMGQSSAEFYALMDTWQADVQAV